MAALAATTGLIAAVLPGTHQESRASILYVPLMLPMVWWLTGLARFEPRPVRLWPHALAAACLVSIAAFAVQARRGDDPLIPAIALGLTLLPAAASLLLRRGSLVDREGPAR